MSFDPRLRGSTVPNNATMVPYGYATRMASTAGAMPASNVVKEGIALKYGDTLGIMAKWQERQLKLGREAFEYFDRGLDGRGVAVRAPELKGKVPLKDALVASINGAQVCEFAVLCFAQPNPIESFSRSLATTLTGAAETQKASAKSEKRSYIFRVQTPAEALAWVDAFNSCILGQFLRERAGKERLQQLLEANMPVETVVENEGHRFTILAWLVLRALRDDDGAVDGFWGEQAMVALRAGARAGNVLDPTLMTECSSPAQIVRFFSLVAGADPSLEVMNAVGPSGRSLLHYAASTGDLHLLTYLLSLGIIDINRADVEGNTPLLLAVLGGFESVAATLLSHNANPNGRGMQCHSPLTASLDRDEPMTSVALALLAARADPNHKCVTAYAGPGGISTLHIAMRRGCVSLVADLLSHGAGVEDRDINGTTVLQAAIASALPDTLLQQMVLASQSLDAEDADGNTALHFAARTGNAEVLRALIARASPNARNRRGQTPVMLAIQGGRADAIDLLARAGGLDGAIADEENRRTAAHYAAVAEPPLVSLIITLAQSNPSVVLARDVHGSTPLTAFFIRPDLNPAAICDEADVVALMSICPDVTALVDGGEARETALHMCSRRGDVAAASALLVALPQLALLLDRGGNTAAHAAAYFGRSSILLIPQLSPAIMRQNLTGGTPLHFAVAGRHAESVRALFVVEGGRVAKFCSGLWDEQGNTPLHAAILTESVECVRAIVESGANLEHRSHPANETALQLAVRLRNAEIVSALVFGGASLAVQLPGSFDSPLHSAVKNGDVAVLEALLSSPSIDLCINMRNAKGETPLHYVYLYHSSTKIGEESLLRMGADGFALDQAGRTPQRITSIIKTDKN